MPGLDYKGGAVKVNGARVGALAGRFYDGTAGRDLVTCPVCRRPADALFGNHGDDPGCARLGLENKQAAANVAAATNRPRAARARG